MGLNAAPQVRNFQRELRWLVDAYEQVQRVRVQTGDRIQKVFAELDRSSTRTRGEGSRSAPTLSQIARGETEGPLPILGRTYRRLRDEERALSESVQEQLRAHPAWPWLGRVSGLSTLSAAMLLAWLNIDRADTPAAWWRFCGLATVPEAEGARTIQPSPAGGRPPGYNPTARDACHTIGTALSKTRGPYREFFRREHARLSRERPTWTTEHVHRAALRKLEKLFLVHLWLVWREAVGLPTGPSGTPPGNPDAPGPWDVAGGAPSGSSLAPPTSEHPSTPPEEPEEEGGETPRQPA